MNQLPEILETPRARLRPYRFEDVEDVLTFAVDPEWARYLPVPQPYSEQDARTFIAQQVLLDRSKNPAWAIEVAGVVIGGVNLRLEPEHHLGELGYSVARAHWGKGIASEVARTVLDTVFSTLPTLNRIRAMADSRNRASQRVMEKLGLVREGVLRHNRVVRGEFVDEVWYGLLRSEWERQR